MTAWLQANWMYVAVGCLAGLLPDILRFVKERHNAPAMTYLSTWQFWVGVLLLVLLGGVAAALAKAATMLQAVAYGYAAPEFISRLVSEQGPPSDKNGPRPAAVAPQSFSLRQWWAK